MHGEIICIMEIFPSDHLLSSYVKTTDGSHESVGRVLDWVRKWTTEKYTIDLHGDNVF